MYMALYRSFRPETFDSILGQEHIVKILRNQIKTATASHAYLFCGTRGTGKTSTARILAKGVNCLTEGEEKPCGTCANCVSIKEGTFMDVIEIDAASNNGVENIRELRESVKYPPAIGRFKVYIIDEVHMLSTGAFNALLKTLEEPPENVMFILATTEVQKLPATILSRCLRLDFKRIPEQTLKDGFRKICEEVGVEISASALGLIVANADGSVRDGLSLLEQCMSAGNTVIQREDILEILGTLGEEVFTEITEYVYRNNIAEALLLINRVLADGKDVRQFMKDWVAHFRSLLMTKFIKNPEDLLNMSCENVERIRKQSEELELSFINHAIIEISKALADAKWSTQPRVLLELAVVKLAMPQEMATAPTVYAEARRAEPPRAAVQAEPKKGTATTARPDVREAPGTRETPASPQEEEPTDSSPKNGNLEVLWEAILTEGETLRGSFRLLRRGTVLKEVGEKRFVIEVANEGMMKYVKDNNADLEGLVEKHVGRNLKIDCVLADDSGKQKAEEGKSVEALADAIGSKLGLNIEIE